MQIEAYNVKTKKKEAMKNAVIDRNGNRCFAKGDSAEGGKLCVAMGLAKAEEAIRVGVASKGEGWD